MMPGVIWQSALWSLLWMVSVALLVFRYTWLIEHDYPEDIRRAMKPVTPTEAQKKQGNAVMAVGWLILLALLVVFGVTSYAAQRVSFWKVLGHLWIINMTWNVVDLLIVDWLIVCTIRPKVIVPPGTENCAGWKDYGFHFKGFLHGCVYMSLFALVFAGIDYAILHFLVW